MEESGLARRATRVPDRRPRLRQEGRRRGSISRSAGGMAEVEWLAHQAVEVEPRSSTRSEDLVLLVADGGQRVDARSVAGGQEAGQESGGQEDRDSGAE